jgi:hypothetical protein
MTRLVEHIADLAPGRSVYVTVPADLTPDEARRVARGIAALLVDGVTRGWTVRECELSGPE